MLIDVRDVALGHTTKMRWNDEAKWIFSEEIVHPAIINDATFQQAQDLLTARRGARGPHKPHKSRHAYALRGLLFCGICQPAHARPLGQRRTVLPVPLPERVRARQQALPPAQRLLCAKTSCSARLDGWLASKFEPLHLPATIEELAAARTTQQPAQETTRSGPRSMTATASSAQYRAALDAGADPATVAKWITETEAERARYESAQRAAPQRTSQADEPREDRRHRAATWPT